MTPSTQDARATGLVELAVRCEQATGADRELDALAAAYQIKTIPCEQYPTVEAWASIAIKQDWNFPRYTGSLDAAMTLVPEGCFARIYGDGAQGIIVRPFSGSYLEVARGFAATPALALTAAALRALAASTKDMNHDG